MSDFFEEQTAEINSNPVETTETTETKEIKKTAKDFTPEEKAAIIARAERIEFSRVAKEFGTTWQTVSAIKKEAQRAAAKKTEDKVKKIKTEEKPESPKEVLTTSGKRRSKDFTAEEKIKVLQRAAEVGLSKAAREANVSRWVIMQWEKKAAAQNPDMQLNIKRSKRGRTPKAKKPVEINQPVVNTKAHDNLEVENAILKEKIASLTEQLEKLRAAVAKLA